MRVEEKMGLRSYESVPFILEDCKVPSAHLLDGESEDGGPSHHGCAATIGALITGRISVSASTLGIARAAYDEAAAYARAAGAVRSERVRDKLEAMLRKLRGARLLTLQAAWLADNGTPNIVESSMAKIASAEVAQELTTLGMEIVEGTG